MVTLEAFNGELNAIGIARWLSSSEDIFKDEANHLGDRDKIHAVGRALARSGITQGLYNWFVENRSTLEALNWLDFKDALKAQALGHHWRMRALEDFFTTSPDGQKMLDYITTLGQKHFVIKENDPTFEDYYYHLYKCYLLFRSPPSLIDQVLRNEGYEYNRFLEATPEEIQNWILNHDNGGIVAPLQATPDMYTLSGLPFRRYPGAHAWSDMRSLPEKASAVGHLDTLTLRWGVNGENILGGYKFQFTDNGDAEETQGFATGGASHTLSLDRGEYITSVKASYADRIFRGTDGSRWLAWLCLKGLEVRTSNPSKMLSVGDFAGGADTQSIITAPRGYRVVGFYGTSWEEYTSAATRFGQIVLKLGLIIAPL
ncbi:hypothetical protein BJX68DRAFT_218401 [Aspergillus pseudodeflectus]|uniref:Jacalin-type lectin domain-containing protein n=1 Tax=Aspergillus pseudodeflectus TaxID=176178 RepID=A0ABR4JDK9_9EURO